jgi:hypothetical protein
MTFFVCAVSLQVGTLGFPEGKVVIGDVAIIVEIALGDGNQEIHLNEQDRIYHDQIRTRLRRGVILIRSVGGEDRPEITRLEIQSMMVREGGSLRARRFAQMGRRIC